MPVHCPGCRKSFRSQDGHNRHLSQSHDERCIAARQPVYALSNNPPTAPLSPPASPSLPSPPLPPPTEFIGDLFGTDYSDLPWLDEVSDGEDEAPQPARPDEGYVARLRQLLEQDFAADDDTFDDFWPTLNDDGEDMQSDPACNYSPLSDTEEVPPTNHIPPPTDRFRFKPIIVHYPGGNAGVPVPPPNAEDEHIDDVDNPWAPFTSRLDWEVARWAKLRGPGSTAFSELLKVDEVRIFYYMFKSLPNCE